MVYKNKKGFHAWIAPNVKIKIKKVNVIKSSKGVVVETLSRSEVK